MLIGLRESAESTKMSIGVFQRKQKTIYMKTKFTLFALMLWISLFHVQGQIPNAVVCADVFLTSQADVNAFNCTEITGTLSISGSDITDLSPLQNLTKVGQLYISGTTSLTNVDGLSGLQFISTYGFPYAISIENNTALKNLDGLSGLAMDTIGWLRINNNASLESINSFTSVTYCGGLFDITNNASLKSFLGFRNLKRIQSCNINNNPALENIDGLASLKTIAGRHASIQISNNAMLQNIDGLSSLEGISGFGITIENNSSITNIDGLRSLTYIRGPGSGSAIIHNNAKLENIDGLSNLKLPFDTGNYGVKVTNNPSLTKCDGIIPVMISYGLSLVAEPNFTISENGSGCTLEDILARIPPAITAFSVFNKNTQYSSEIFFDNAYLEIAQASFPYLILRAETNANKVGSVEFRINNTYSVVDNAAPFELDLQAMLPGHYDVVTTPYPQPNKQGEKGYSRTLSLDISLGAQINSFPVVDLNGNWIKYLMDGDKIDLKDARFKAFAVKADAYPERPAFVKFWLNGELVATDNTSPYTLAGDSGDGKIFNAWNPKPGSYTLRAIPYVTHANQILAGTPLEIKFEVIGEPTAITSFNLVDTSGKILRQLNEGDKINIGDPAHKPFTIVANTTGKVGSVKLQLDQSVITENFAPYTATGDNNGYYNPWKSSIGNHSVSATPYANPNGQGDAGQYLKINFIVVNEPPLAITRFDIVNTAGKILKQLQEGDKINLNDPAYKTFTIVATVIGKAGSVKIKLDQSLITENVAPYTATGDNNGYFNPWNASLGNHTISAIPYVNASGQGAAGKELKINFSVVKENTAALFDATVSLYPVPVKEELFLEVKNSTCPRFSVVLRNGQGHSIHTGSYEPHKANNYKIMTSGLPAGIYFLQLRDSNGGEKVIRIMK
jgi:hypothetical protein